MPVGGKCSELVTPPVTVWTYATHSRCKVRYGADLGPALAVPVQALGAAPCKVPRCPPSPCVLWIPCPYAKWKRCPVCGPKNGLCKVKACVAARKPLLLGFNPAVGAQEGAEAAQ